MGLHIVILKNEERGVAVCVKPELETEFRAEFREAQLKKWEFDRFGVRFDHDAGFIEVQNQPVEFVRKEIKEVYETPLEGLKARLEHIFPGSKADIHEAKETVSIVQPLIDGSELLQLAELKMVCKSMMIKPGVSNSGRPAKFVTITVK